MRGSKTGERHAEWRAAHVVESNLVVEVDGSGIAAGFAADTDGDVLLGRTAAFDRDLDEFANAIDIDGLERIEFIDLLLVVIREELSRIVTAEAHGELREIVGSEAEEFGFVRKVPGLEAASWDFDHRTNVVVELVARFGHFAFDGVDDDGLGEVKLFLLAGKRNHDLRFNVFAKVLAGFEGGLDDGGRLHTVDFRIGDAKTDATEAHHRVGLVELVDAVANLLFGHAEFFSDVFDLLIFMDVR